MRNINKIENTRDDIYSLSIEIQMLLLKNRRQLTMGMILNNKDRIKRSTTTVNLEIRATIRILWTSSLSTLYL